MKRLFLGLIALLVLSLLVTRAQTPGAQPEFCITSPSQTANYNQLCMSVTNTGAAIGVTNFGSATGSLAGGNFSLKSPPCNAVGDGVADDTAAINACEVARPAGSSMVWPPGTYKLTGPINTVSGGSWDMQGVTINSVCGNLLLNNSNFILNGGRSTFNFSACAGANQNRAVRINKNGTFTTNGTVNPGVTGEYSISGNVTAGATSFVAGRSQDAATLSPGDWIDVLYAGDTGGVPQAEMKQVLSVAGTTINVTVPFAQPLTTGAIGKFGAITGGSGYTNSTYLNVPLTGGSGTTATANIVVSGGAVTTVAIVNLGQNYAVSDALSASNANLGGGGSGFSIPVSGIWTPGWFKILNTIQNVEVNGLNIVAPATATSVIGLDGQVGVINGVYKNLTFDVLNGLSTFIYVQFNPQFIDNVIMREIPRHMEFSQTHGGRIGGNKWWTGVGASGGGPVINSGAFGLLFDHNEIDGLGGAGIISVNDASYSIVDHNLVTCVSSAIAIVVLGGNNNIISGNNLNNCNEGITLQGDSGTFVNGTWSASKNLLTGNLLRNIVNGVHTATNSTFTNIVDLNVDATVTNPTVLAASGDTTFFNSNGRWGFNGSVSINGLDGVNALCIAGVTRGIRFGMDGTGGTIQGVDNTCLTSFQPLTIGGGAATNFTGVLNFGSVSGAGGSSKTVCVDASNNVLLKTGAC